MLTKSDSWILSQSFDSELILPFLQREFQCFVNIQNSHVNFNVDKDNFFDTKSFVNDWVIKYESLLMDKNW